MVSRSVLVASTFAVLAVAQSSGSAMQASTTVSQSMPAQATAGFNPGNVSYTDAYNWCLAQQHSCPQICGGSASVNQCDATAFTYSCICTNGTEPDCTAYEQTLPFYMCEATYAQCIADHPDDSIGQGTCMTNEQCGTKNATSGQAVKTGTSSASASATSSASGSASSGAASASASGSASGTASVSAASSSPTKGAAAFTNEVATGAFAAIFLAAFKLLL